ncbi:membrane bound O-acyl transferase family-domain-containing protein [Lasiosphaeria hispida]|uniref:Membrane bound O-acyl transferase family-domain-containing protein n=1 Tax=Lasiosphaeria hispida TaxID=260671 RepID=A0AAJ0HK27_9PEZI|nr:membrane bound O-acyl transferase family-domain-containing protein [Lasiosphaeria hispida]
MTLHYLPVGRGLLYNVGIYLTIASLLWPVGLFTAEPIKLFVVADGKTRPVYRWNLRQAYRIYNNPRKLPDRLNSSSLPTARALVWFAVRRLVQISGLVVLYGTITVLIFTVGGLLYMEPSDFTPEREPLFSIRDSWDLRIRCSVLVFWVMQGVVPLQIMHFLLSIVFVSILRVDGPDEWPPLFSSPLQAFTLKRYWGIFWHRLFSPGAVTWARFVARRGLQLPPGSTIEKVLVPFIVFSVSGAAHAAVGWRLGYCCLVRDIKFFWWNFAAIFAETVVLKGIRVVFVWLPFGETTPQLQRQRNMLVKVTTRVVGYLWVLMFFLWAMPPYLYPKGYDSLRRKGLIIEPESPAIGALPWD